MNGSQVVCITGATSGIGRACVDMLVSQGFLVAALGRRTERLDAIKRDWGTRVLPLCVDVTKPDEMQKAMNEIVWHWKRLDVLVNNAGVGYLGPMQDAPLEDWHAMLDINVKGLLNGFHFALPHLLEAKGIVINIASVAAHDVFPNATVYCASKHAVKAITIGLRKEFRGRLRIGEISPGAVQTEFVEHTRASEFKNQFVASFEKASLHANKIADALCYMISQDENVEINEIIIRPFEL